MRMCNEVNDVCMWTGSKNQLVSLHARDLKPE